MTPDALIETVRSVLAERGNDRDMLPETWDAAEAAFDAIVSRLRDAETALQQIDSLRLKEDFPTAAAFNLARLEMKRIARAYLEGQQ